MGSIRHISVNTSGYDLRPFRLRHRLGLALGVVMLLAAPGGGFAQQTVGGAGFPQQSPNAGQFPSASSRSGLPQQQDGGPFSGMDQSNTFEAEKRIRMINVERQKSMVSDTDKLLKLAKELNDEIAHSNGGALTGAQLHKVAEIEKLAHSVRDKMTMTVRSTQFNMMDTSPYFPSPH